VLRLILKGLRKIPFKRVIIALIPPYQRDITTIPPYQRGIKGVVFPPRLKFPIAINNWSEVVSKILTVKLLAGLMLCFVAAPVMINSTETVSNAVKKSGYPYRDADIEWMDMGLWLAKNASPDSITMTRNPWELHFYSEQLAVQIPRTTLEKTIEVMRYYNATYIIPQLDIRPSLKPLVEGKVPGLELAYDNKKLQLYKIRYDLLPEPDKLQIIYHYIERGNQICLNTQ